MNALRIGGAPAPEGSGLIEVIVRRVTGRPALAALTVAAIAPVVTSPVLALPGNMIPPDPRQLPPGDDSSRTTTPCARPASAPRWT